jgi:PIN domain nuclease of toxin-antitoxin system
MKLLLDTHSFLWFISGDSNLRGTARSLIEEPTNDLFLSAASIWEMAIKIGLGKLKIGEPFEKLIPEQLRLNAIDILNIEIEHTSALIALPFHHRDPFDRLLIAQSLVEKLPLISIDSAFDPYGVTRYW